MCTKSGSRAKVGFFLSLDSFLLLTLGFNSLGLSGGMPLISLTTISPGLFLIPTLMLNNLIKFKTIL